MQEVGHARATCSRFRSHHNTEIQVVDVSAVVKVVEARHVVKVIKVSTAAQVSWAARHAGAHAGAQQMVQQVRHAKEPGSQAGQAAIVRPCCRIRTIHRPVDQVPFQRFV